MKSLAGSIDRAGYAPKLSSAQSHSAVVSDDGFFYTWGTGKDGQLGVADNFESQLPRIIGTPLENNANSQVATNSKATFILIGKTLFSFGMQKQHVLGRSDLQNRIGKVQFEGDAPPIDFVASNSYHSIAVAEHGEFIYVWGEGKYGALGTGSTEKIDVPFKVSIFNTIGHRVQISQVATGLCHSLALSVGGDVYAWGTGANGRLGLGSSEDVLYPTKVSGLGYSSSHVVVQIVAGDSHSIALTDEGIVLSWGSGSYGRLGHGELFDQLSPRVVRALGEKHVWFVACNQFHSAAVTHLQGDKSNSVLFTWGCGRHGKLGHGDSHMKTVPTLVSFFTENLVQITQISCGLQFTIALTDDGRMFSWGLSQGLRCGIRQIDSTVETVDLLYPRQVDYGNDHVCTGDAVSFNLRINKFAEISRRAKAQSCPIVEIDAGDSHSLALDENGNMFTWGVNAHGQLGTGEQSDFCPRPVAVKSTIGMQIKITQIACGAFHSLAAGDGAIFSWGWNNHGQLGLQSAGENERDFVAEPTLVKSLQGTFVQKVACGSFHSAAIGRFVDDFNDEIDYIENLQRGRLFIWGCCEDGRLALGDTKVDQYFPRPVKLGPISKRNVRCIEIALGDAHSIALFEQIPRSEAERGHLERYLFVSGKGSSGQLGLVGKRRFQSVNEFTALDVNGNTEHNEGITSKSNPDEEQKYTIERIAAGGDASMALLSHNSRSIVCLWGRHFGFDESTQPDWIINPPAIIPQNDYQNKPIRGLDVGCSHSVIFGSSFAKAWGRNDYGKLGKSKGGSICSPLSAVSGDWNKSILRMKCGNLFSIALTADGKVFSWGCPKDGRLGQGDDLLDVMQLSDPFKPQPIKGLSYEKISDDVEFNEFNESFDLPRSVSVHVPEKFAEMSSEYRNVDLFNAKGVLMSLQNLYVDLVGRAQQQLQSRLYYLKKAENVIQQRIEQSNRSLHLDIRLNPCIAEDDEEDGISGIMLSRQDIESILQSVITKFHVHPCFLRKMVETIDSLEESSNLHEVFCDFVFSVWDMNRPADRCLFELFLKAFLERKFKTLQSKSGKALKDTLFTKESISWKLCFDRLWHYAGLRRMFDDLFLSWMSAFDHISLSKDSFSSKTAFELAQSMFSQLTSFRRKNEIQSQMGWLIGFMVEQLRTRMEDSYEFIGFKFISALVEYMKPKSNNEMFHKSLQMLLTFASEVLHKGSKVDIDNDSSQMEQLSDIRSATDIRDLVIDISRTDTIDIKYRQELIESVVSDRILHNDRIVFFKHSFGSLLHSLSLSELFKWEIPDMTADFVHSIPFNGLLVHLNKLPELSLYSETSIIECPQCNLWCSPAFILLEDSNAIRILERQSIVADVRSASQTLTNPSSSTVDQLTSEEFSPLECAILYLQLKSSHDKATQDAVLAVLQSDSELGYIEGKLLEKLHRKVSEMSKWIAHAKNESEVTLLMRRYKAVATVARVINAIGSTLRKQFRSSDRMIIVPPVELTRDLVPFFVASLKGPYGVTSASKDVRVIVDAVLAKLLNALEMIVTKDKSMQMLLERKLKIYYVCIISLQQILQSTEDDLDRLKLEIIPNIVNGKSHRSLRENKETYESTGLSKVMRHRPLKGQHVRTGLGWQIKRSYTQLRMTKVLSKGIRRVVSEIPEIVYDKDPHLNKRFKSFFKPLYFIFSSGTDEHMFTVRLVLGRNRLLYTSQINVAQNLGEENKHFALTFEPREKDQSIISKGKFAFLFSVSKLRILLDSIPRSWA